MIENYGIQTKTKQIKINSKLVTIRYFDLNSKSLNNLLDYLDDKEINRR